MAGGLVGEQPYGIDPLQLLNARVQSNAAGVLPAPAAGPSPAGGGPAPAGDASPNVTASTPGFNIGGVGTALSRAFSGEGILNNGEGADETIDPVTGATRGIHHRSNMQSMMKMGLLLMAAGQPQTPESRAAILSKVGGALDNTDSINSFAKNRLEMAKTKLLERQAAQDAALQATIMAKMGGGTSTSGAGSATGLEAGPAATTTAPVTPATAVAPVISPAPGAAPSVAPVAPGIAPAAPGTVTPATPPTAATPGAAGRAAIPGTDEAAPPPIPQIGPPPAPPKRTWKPDDADRFAIAMQARVSGAAGAKEWADREEKWKAQEVENTAYVDPKTGLISKDVYRNDGTKVRTVSLGPAQGVIRDRKLPDGTLVREKVAPDGSVLDRSEVRDPAADEVRKANVGAEYGAIKGDRDDILKVHNEQVRDSLNSYKRLTAMQKNIDDKKIIAGTGADYRVSAINALASTGLLPPAEIERLIATKEITAEAGRIAGEFAKKYYGPQIAVADVTNAREATGMALSNDPAVVRAGLERARALIRDNLQIYNERAKRHNSTLPEDMPKSTRERMSVPTIDKDLDGDNNPATNLTPRQKAAAELLAQRKSAAGAR